MLRYGRSTPNYKRYYMYYIMHEYRSVVIILLPYVHGRTFTIRYGNLLWWYGAGVFFITTEPETALYALRCRSRGQETKRSTGVLSFDYDVLTLIRTSGRFIMRVILNM